jgi:hypothetical protein
MIIDSATLLILSVCFASISITEKILKIAVKKKSFIKLKNFITRNKEKIEESIKYNKSITIDDEFKDVVDEVLQVEYITNITHEIIDFVKISK